LIQYCKENRFILDQVGSGPKRLTNFVK
jgi:hypothetical protein